MKRNNGYYRRMRIKHIKRKKRIAQFYYGEDYSCIAGNMQKEKYIVLAQCVEEKIIIIAILKQCKKRNLKTA